VDLRASLEDLERRKFLTLLGLELRPIGLPARSQSLYTVQTGRKIKFTLFSIQTQIPHLIKIYAAVLEVKHTDRFTNLLHSFCAKTTYKTELQKWK
jgi:hypothetical protein